MKALFKEIKDRIIDQLIEPYNTDDEFVEFDESEFAEYKKYDKAYPDRFRVKYDANLNRIWK